MIHGRNILIYEGDVVIAAAKSCTINTNAEAVENSSPASGTARSYTVGRTGWEISISTLVLSMKDHLLQTGHSYTLTWKERDSDTDTMTGTAICTAAQVDAAVGNLAQGSFQFLGSDSNGTVVPEPTPTPSDYVTEQDVRNIINLYGFTTEQFVENYSGIAGGTITIGDASITPVSSIAMSSNALGLTVSGSPITSAGTFTLAYASGYEGFTTALKNKIEEIYSWFEVDANGDIKTKDTAGGHVRGFYTESFVSALGANSSGGGGGGGIELSDVWQSLKTNTDDYANQKINAAHIPDLSGTYATKTWVNQQGFVTSSGVTSVAMTVPTGLSVSGSPITSTGTLALTFTSGYSIPTTTKQGNWDTAYGWGNHATAGYASASSVTTLQGYFNTGGVAKVAAKLNTGTTTYSAWGVNYWENGVPKSVSGNMTSVGSITPSANGNALGTTSARFNIYGTAGNFSGNVSITGTLGVTGAATLSSSLSVASGITLTTTKKIYFGDTSHYLELNSTGFHFSHGVYSDSFVSALGANSSGGGGGVDLTAVWASLTNTENPTYSTTLKINSNHIPDLAASKITSGTFDTARIPNLDASKITSGTFAAARIPDLSGRYYALYGGTPLTGTSSSHYDLDTLTDVGSYYCTANVIAQYFDNKPTNDNWAFRVWVSAPTGTSSSYVRQRFQYYNRPYIYERVSVSDDGISWGSWYLVQDNLGSYALASDYLPLTGGTLTGGINIKFDTDSSRANGYSWQNTSGTNVASVTYHNTAQNIILNPIGSSDIWSDAIGKYSLIVGNNSLTYNTYPILHSNNYSSYALPLTGGTITGNLISTKSGTAEAYFRATNSNGSIELLTSTNRGVYDRTTTTWLIGTDGTNTWLSQGNVGIGTTSPAYKLDVVGSIRASDGVYVGTGGAAGNSYVTSDEADNIYLRNSSGAVLVCDSKVVRRGKTLSDVTLGSSSYPWLAAYATTFYGALSGNATTATTASKLSTTSKTAWGQTYWTSGGVPTSISGNLSDVGNITADYYTLNNTSSNPYLKLVHSYNSTNYNYYIQAYTGLLYLGAGSANSMAINSTGQVFLTGHLFLQGAQAASSTGNTTQIIFRTSAGVQQVAISSNSSALIINPTSSTTTGQIILGVGTVNSTFGTNIISKGEVTAQSDERKKNIISDTKFSIKDIASARSIIYEWNDGRDKDKEKKIHGGSIAQDWLGKADSFLMQDEDGFYSINYGALALCSAITIAKEVVRHDDEITRLKKEVVKLRERVAELEERRIA